ncbi:MAG: porin [Bacteroidia bacterium]|nr:porin [Bacteroidia bacterium]MCZ2249520.1 porin [Bacteroidia bacterium]
MKIISKTVALFAIINFSIIQFLSAQSTLSDADRQSIVQQVKKEVIDSLNNEPQKPIGQISKSLSISGYLETYYSYDFANPENHIRQPFVYAYNRHNEFNVNLALIKLSYATENARANIALMAGTYSNDNLAAEPGVMKNIYEANAGFKISKKKNLWIDAGVFVSHIGFESAVGKDCWTLTRSIMADNSPYYETGAKISYTTDNGKWFISGLVLNGWQRIYRPDGNNFPAFSHQLTYKPNSKVTLNSSSFIGSDKPDTARQMRYFHNLYGQFQLHEKFGMIAGFDIGAQQQSKNSSTYTTWYAPILILKVSPTDKFSIAARGEYYNDASGVIISTGTPNNFQIFGYSLNLDYLIHNTILWRIEGRGFSSKDKIFVKDGNPIATNSFLTSSLAISF